jgi:hypothetical protein
VGEYVSDAGWLAPRVRDAAQANFDNTGRALLSLLQVLSFQGARRHNNHRSLTRIETDWQTVMFSATGVVGIGQQPAPNSAPYFATFFVLFGFVMGFFAVNMVFAEQLPQSLWSGSLTTVDSLSARWPSTFPSIRALVF